MRSIAATFVSLIALLASAQGPGGGRGNLPPPLVRENATEKISEHVYVIPDNNAVLVPNIGIIVGSRATLVVDTGMGTRNGQTVMREVEKVSRHTELYWQEPNSARRTSPSIANTRWISAEFVHA